MTSTDLLKGVHWLGHASFRIEDAGTVIYLDPWKLKTHHPATLILVTHHHHDHLSPDDIARIATPKTVVVCPAACKGKLSGDVRYLEAGEALQVGNVRVEAVPAYNIGKVFHPRSAGFVGYVVEVGRRRIYHAGDTDLIPEMADVRCDVALLPIGGKYTMDAAEATQAAERIGPKVAVPMHWGGIVGSKRDAELLASRVPATIEAVIMPLEA